MSQPLADAQLPGLGPARLRRLSDLGVASLEALADSDVGTLSALPGFGKAVAEQIVTTARERLAGAPPPAAAEDPTTGTNGTNGTNGTDASVDLADDTLPPPPMFEPDGELSGTKRLARGMKVARRLEALAEVVRRARGHAGEARESVERAKARKELRRLHEQLEGLVQAVLTDGIGKKAADELSDRTGPLDASLKDFLTRKPRKSALKAVRKAARYTRSVLG